VWESVLAKIQVRFLSAVVHSRGCQGGCQTAGLGPAIDRANSSGFCTARRTSPTSVLTAPANTSGTIARQRSGAVRSESAVITSGSQRGRPQRVGNDRAMEVRVGRHGL
jgi:hypothetical protein